MHLSHPALADVAVQPPSPTRSLADDALPPPRWTVSAPPLRASLAAQAPRVTVLAARGWWAYRQGYVPGAVHLAWRDRLEAGVRSRRRRRGAGEQDL